MGNGLRWTAEQLQAAQARAPRKYAPPGLKPSGDPMPGVDIDAVHARGSLKPRKMNKIEAAYGDLLKGRPDVVWTEFEGITLRLGDDCRYTPDWPLMLADGTLEMHETKGFMRDDALVKIKAAAARYPFRFVLVRREKSEWIHREIRP